jgi:uncharacterized protein YqgC (DUF456 family)
MTNPYQSPEHGPYRQPATGDATGGLIPYKNVPALLAYYLGIFSLIPAIGLLLGPPAVILGIVGLIKKSKTPQVRGTAHALIGIILGSVTTLVWGGCVLLMIVGALSNP